VRRQIEDGLFYIANWSLLFAVPWQSHLAVSWRSLGVQPRTWQQSRPLAKLASLLRQTERSKMDALKIQISLACIDGPTDTDISAHIAEVSGNGIQGAFEATGRRQGKQGRNKHPMVIQSQEQQIGGTAPGCGGRPRLVVSVLQEAKKGRIFAARRRDVNIKAGLGFIWGNLG